MKKDPKIQELIRRCDAINYELAGLRQDMRGISPMTETYAKLGKRCLELGVEARELMKQRVNAVK